MNYSPSHPGARSGVCLITCASESKRATRNETTNENQFRADIARAVMPPGFIPLHFSLMMGASKSVHTSRFLADAWLRFSFGRGGCAAALRTKLIASSASRSSRVINPKANATPMRAPKEPNAPPKRSFTVLGSSTRCARITSPSRSSSHAPATSAHPRGDSEPSSSMNRNISSRVSATSDCMAHNSTPPRRSRESNLTRRPTPHRGPTRRGGVRSGVVVAACAPIGRARRKLR